MIEKNETDSSGDFQNILKNITQVESELQSVLEEHRAGKYGLSPENGVLLLQGAWEVV